MSQSPSTPAANNPNQPVPTTPPSATPPPVAPSFRASGTAMGSVLSKLGPLLLVALAIGVIALFYSKHQVDSNRDFDDLVSQKVYSASRIPEAPKRIAAYEELLKNSDYKDHPSMVDVRMVLINEYFDITSSYDAPQLTSDQTKKEYRARALELIGTVLTRPVTDQRTILATYKHGQIAEDDKEYLKAIDDYKKVREMSDSLSVLVKPMKPFASFRIASCYYWLFRGASNETDKAGYRTKALDALTEAEGSKEISQSFSESFKFIKRELQAPGDLLLKAPDLKPRSPVELERQEPAHASAAPAVNPDAPVTPNTPATPPVTPATTPATPATPPATPATPATAPATPPATPPVVPATPPATPPAPATH